MYEPLKPDETELRGNWISEGNRVFGDLAEQRIEFLTKNILRRIAIRDRGWTILYQDPSDGRYWQLTFPNGGMHGGGPQALNWLREEDAKKLFGLK